jgi:radical SAM protein with 4Fe4S-binding SPASM domain
MTFRDLIKTGKLELWSRYKGELRKNHDLTYLFWECTLNCNFSCQHCGSRAGRGKRHKNELTSSEIKKVLGDIANTFNPRKIMIAVTGGEPLLRPDLFNVMRFANDLGFEWGMVTNGYLVNREVVKKAALAGMSTVVVSIDGIGEAHDQFRGMKGAYNRAISAIKLLAEPKFLKDIQITTVIHKGNISELENFYREFTKLPITSWRIANVDPIGRAEDNDILLDQQEIKSLLEFIRQKRKKSKIDVTYGCSNYLGKKYEGELRGWLFNCNTGINTGSILHNGDIYVCPNVPRIPKLIQGNVRTDNFADVWSEKFEFFRDQNRTACSDCKKCEDWEYCLGNSMHLWNFEQKKPKVCFKKFLDI